MKQYFLAERLKYRHTSMNVITVMMPLITVQAMGGIYVLKSKRGAEKVTALPYDEREIIELWEAC